MTNSTLGKGKIFNDPIYGFITIPNDIIFKLIEHPYFQRLRRIKQLGLTHLVYSGAHHTRFHHAIGAMHLMHLAIDTLRAKGIEINEEERYAALIAILLHDIGHGPFSHTLEQSIVRAVTHEEISIFLMGLLNIEFNGELSMAISVFEGSYHKKFLHQLVSSQLDMDRLDYLKRDTYFSGVSEGVVSSDRIIKMLNVVNDELVVEEKGIYSVEKFIIARRLMYWQVYLHKTVIAAETLLMKILRRAKDMARAGKLLFASPSFHFFLYHDITKEEFENDGDPFKHFCKLDDYDIMLSIKVWCEHEDVVLSLLCQRLVRRKLFGVELKNTPYDKKRVNQKLEEVAQAYGISIADAGYFVFSEKITNNAYDPSAEKISIYLKNGNVVDIVEAAEILNISVLSGEVNKYFFCYPKKLN